MRKLFFTLFLLLFLGLFVFLNPVLAIENSIDLPNNKFGIHILFPEEIGDAAQLVNSSGGDWGYVVIPIQAGDKNLEKWQNFMDRAKELHLIPILRLATEGDYFNTKVWRKPEASDVLDFANFLNSLEWPIKNRYVIIFNEVNRADEWGGGINPSEYADLLYYSALVFKSKNPDFFIISAGLDNAAPNKAGQYMNQYNFLLAMNAFLPEVFRGIDGIASHSYPNPGFSQPPSSTSRSSVISFFYERDLIKSFTGKDFPVFITETGWSKTVVPEEIVANYYLQAFSSVWSDPALVSVSPFLLRADEGPFVQFSILNNGKQGMLYKTLASFPKIKGTPQVNMPVKNKKYEVLGDKIIPEKKFPFNTPVKQTSISLSSPLKQFTRWLLKI